MSTSCDSAEMECGSSLAEYVWSVPSIASDQTSEAVNNISSTVDEAWSKLRRLRSLLASDVIADPPRSDHPTFPTFISPFDSPESLKHQSNQSYKGMSIPLIYCDHTASHRPLYSIENYLQTVSMPCHANTHTNITYTGSQSTAFVSEARQIVAEATGAHVTGKASVDAVLFGGNGVTGIVALLIDCLNLRGIVQASPQLHMRPVVFVGPHEHHSNLLPWRESGCEVITIPEKCGMVHLEELERLLQLPQYSRHSGRLRMGAFSAASNVTGLIADVDAIAILLHKYGALAFFDYASGAPYLSMDMNPKSHHQNHASATFSNNDEENVDPSKDAIYFSPHKCFGGTSTPGVLIVKKHLISQTNPPIVSGGGTVFYVTNQDHRFLSNRIERYEGGTPDGIGIQRVGLALLAGRQIANEYKQIVQSINQSEREHKVPKTLLEYECSTYDRVVTELKNHAPNLIVLGSLDTETIQPTPNSSCVGRHLPIFSFLIRCGRRFLHYNYVCAILNDVFGIQSRGGCQCAGPYSQRLLGLTKTIVSHCNGEPVYVEVPNDANRQIENMLLRSDRPCELLRPGYTRLSLPFKGLREEEVDYVIDALIWVAKNGWVLLPQYRCDHRTGEWRHWSRRGKPLGKTERRWLSHFDVLSPESTISRVHLSFGSDNTEASLHRLKCAMNSANAILDAAKSNSHFLAEVEKMNTADGMLGSLSDSTMAGINNAMEDLRWYVYQKESAPFIRERLNEVPLTNDEDALLGSILRQNINDHENVGLESSTLINNFVSENQERSVSMQDSESKFYSFQDGDHSGEASLNDIKTGFDDGELGEDCIIFNYHRDEWVPIREFVRCFEDDLPLKADIGRKRDISTMKNEVAAVESIVSEETPSPKGFESMKDDTMDDNASVSTSLPRNSLSDGDQNHLKKREKKKPSRDSSLWGQCSVPHVTAMSLSTHAVPVDKIHQDDIISNNVSKDGLPESEVSSKSYASEKNKMHKAKIKPPPKLMRFITQAIMQWDMIQEGDRLLLGLSGGKDSLSLLHCLLEFQRKMPIKFYIEVCTIDPLTPSFDPSPLIPYVEGLGLKYHYIRDDIVARANISGKDGKTVSSLCAYCARMKRGNLYTCARKNNCNKLVLAQHLDDCVESFLMSVMHNGFIRTMKANYKINAGDISVIRPLVYCRESLMTEFAKSANLPVINENCPACFEEPKERARMKKLLSREETLYPSLYDHIKRAIIPVMHDDSTAIMRSYLEEVIAKSRKVQNTSPKAAAVDHIGAEFNDSSGASYLSNGISGEVSLQGNAITLECATEEELIAELAKRRAAKYHLYGAMKRLPNNCNGTGDDDPTGQICTLTGGDGTIPCIEIME